MKSNLKIQPRIEFVGLGLQLIGKALPNLIPTPQEIEKKKKKTSDATLHYHWSIITMLANPQLRPNI